MEQDRLGELEEKVARLEAHIARLEAELEDHLVTCPGTPKVARDRATRKRAAAEDRRAAEA